MKPKTAEPLDFRARRRRMHVYSGRRKNPAGGLHLGVIDPSVFHKTLFVLRQRAA